MWKDKQNGKALKNLYYVSYEIKGLNLDRLIETFKKRGIALFNVKKYGNKRLIITVRAVDNEKIFAISKELCYNIKKLREGGRFYPLVFLVKNVGIVVGTLVFILSALFTNDIVLNVAYTGSGAKYYREVDAFLEDKGVKKFTKFSSFDLKVLSAEILGANQNLSFVSCQKHGNTLKINLALQNQNTQTLTGKQKYLLSDCAGVVESLKVYSGTPLVAVGDAVQKGDLLVDGVSAWQDKIIPVDVVAYVTLKVDVSTKYISANDEAETEALAFCLAKTQDKAIISSRVEKIQDGQNYIYNVTLTVRKTLYAG